MPDYSPLRISNDIAEDPAALQAQLETEGYLFVKGVMNPDKLLELRRQVMSVLQDWGWLVSGTDPIDGIADISAQCTEGDLHYAQAYHAVYRLPLFHESAHWPEVMTLMERVIGEPILPHPQKIARLWFPQYTAHTTPVHQDFVHFQGCYDTYTCWSPIGDCPIELGALAVLPGSHRPERVLTHHFSLGAGNLSILPDDLSGEWHTADFELGDVLIFNALMAHKALPNLTEDRLRASLDNRYVARSRPIAEHMLEPHLGEHDGFGWNQVYESWDSKELQYYWLDEDITVVPRDQTWRQIAFDEALELATNGDNSARHHLARIVARAPDSENAQRAAAAIALHGEDVKTVT